MQVHLTLDTIGNLNRGMAEGIINKALQEAIKDLEDRGEEDGLPREVSIKISFRTEDKLPRISCSVTTKVPPRRSGDTAAELRYREGEPSLVFQTENPERADQQTFPIVDGEEKPEE